MVEPTIVPRSAHAISRRDIDPDALKVLYRLHEHHYTAYLVGGSVRDLLLRRRPKDFDIGSFSIIDYVGGLDDLDARVIRSIGDPEVRFLEDPVRMLRAVVLAARLDFRIDEPVLEAIERQRHEIARSAPSRVLEEFYKILRSGSAETSLRMLQE